MLENYMENDKLEKTRMSNDEKLKIMKEYIKKTGKKITANTKYNGYNIGYMQNNLRQKYFNNQLKIDDGLLREFKEYGIIIENKEKNRSDYQEKYEFLISIIEKSDEEKLESKMKNGLSYKKVIYQIQTDYNRGKLNLTEGQIKELKKAGFLKENKKEKEEISFYGFKGIALSSRDITEYQKLNYSLFIKDIFKEMNMSFKYDTNKYIDIDAVDNLLLKYKTKEQEVIKMHYGLDGLKYKFKEIEAKFELARGRSGQITKKILNELSKQDINLIIGDNNKNISDLNKYKEEYKIISKKIEELKNKLSKPKNIVYENDIKLEELEFSVRTYNCLKRFGKNSLVDIINCTNTELLKCRNLGIKNYQEIMEKLDLYGVRLKNEDEEINPYIKRIKLKENNDFVSQNIEDEINNLQLHLIDLMEKINITNNHISSYNLAVEKYLKEENIYEKDFVINSNVCYSTGNIFNEESIAKLKSEYLSRINQIEKNKMEKEEKEQEIKYKLSLNSMERFILEFEKTFDNVEQEDILQNVYFKWIAKHKEDINNFYKILRNKSSMTIKTKELLKKYSKEIKKFYEYISYFKKFMLKKISDFNDYVVEFFRKEDYKIVKEYWYRKTVDGILMFTFRMSNRDSIYLDTNVELDGWHINLYIDNYNFSKIKAKALDILNKHDIMLLNNSHSFYVGEQHLNLYSFDFNSSIEIIYNKNIELIQLFLDEF